MKLTAGLLGVALLALIAGGARAAQARSIDTLQLKGTVNITWQPADCPPGTSGEECSQSTGVGVLPGLGAVSTKGQMELSGAVLQSSCWRFAYALELTVVGKGTIDMVSQTPACLSAGTASPTLQATVIGGTGLYAGATGSGTLTSRHGEYPKGADDYALALTVPGLSFDVTPPVLSGIKNKIVRAPRRAKRARVTYAVTAQDAVDGSVPASCTPPSGSRFKLGKTAVTCSAKDSSGNTATAKFTVTVKRHA